MTCQLHISHSPEPLNSATHHILPLSWGGADIVANKLVVCPTGHENLHTVLNWFVRFKGTELPWEYRRRIGSTTWSYALRAWDEHTGPTPYTGIIGR